MGHPGVPGVHVAGPDLHVMDRALAPLQRPAGEPVVVLVQRVPRRHRNVEPGGAGGAHGHHLVVGLGREDLIIAGILIYKEIFEATGFNDCTVFDDGLREGLAIAVCKKINIF